ncbi:unnamed protein product [Durusdinium trenchii]|uniref:Uncharacterized protein n=2 Tax=Durusdinium trenchii TaxID=1381693 RepID=A0ABP0HZR8_9DINO
MARGCPLLALLALGWTLGSRPFVTPSGLGLESSLSSTSLRHPSRALLRGVRSGRARSKLLRYGQSQSRRSLVQQALDFLPVLPGVWFVYLFSRLPKQYIAANGDPNASSGTGAETWGLWTKDPGPRGVRLKNFPRLAETGEAPAGWSFDQADWWLEEHGLIMEQPEALPPGKYEVTGDREVTTTLTIYPKDSNGQQRWELANGAKLFDVTHLPCRSARYTGARCSPAAARPSDFPVTPGAAMPPVAQCQKQDHAVLFVLSSQSS